MDNLQNALNDLAREVGNLVELADAHIPAGNDRERLSDLAERLDKIQARLDSMAK